MKINTQKKFGNINKIRILPILFFLNFSCKTPLNYIGKTFSAEVNITCEEVFDIESGETDYNEIVSYQSLKILDEKRVLIIEFENETEYLKEKIYEYERQPLGTKIFIKGISKEDFYYGRILSLEFRNNKVFGRIERDEEIKELEYTKTED